MSINQGENNQEVRSLLDINWRFLCLIKQLIFNTLYKKNRTGRNLFDYDDSLLCGLVCDNVEHVVTANDAVLHLCIASDVWVLRLDSTNGTSHLYGLQRCHAERI